MRRPWHEAASKAASAPTGLRLPCYAQEHFLLERKNQKPLAENRHLHKNQDTTGLAHFAHLIWPTGMPIVSPISHQLFLASPASFRQTGAAR